MNKFCQQCGKQLQPDQGFCDHCGSAWTAPESAAASAAAVPYTPQPVVVSRSSGWPIVIVAIVAFAAIGIGAWYFLTTPSAASKNVAASSGTSTVTTSTSVTSVSAAPALAAAAVPPVTDTTTATTTDAVAGSEAATEVAAGSKQCSLITRAEMGTILGKKIVRVIAEGQMCSYFTDADRSAQVETTWTGGKEALTAAKGFSEGLLTPVPDIGDEAYMHAAGVLHVLKGDTYVVVNSREYPNEHENESAIARKIMEKMK